VFLRLGEVATGADAASAARARTRTAFATTRCRRRWSLARVGRRLASLRVKLDGIAPGVRLRLARLADTRAPAAALLTSPPLPLRRRLVVLAFVRLVRHAIIGHASSLASALVAAQLL
jgi:hypothetical protein